MERIIEGLFFGSRLLLVPIYLGLLAALVMFAVQFFNELAHLATVFTSMPESDLLLAMLSLVDVVLVANLIIMVVISSYENFISKIDAVDVAQHKIGWLGKLDAGTLKIKLAVSIVAISSIQLLKAFMGAKDVPADKMMWMVIVHLTLVASAVMMALVDKIAFSAHREH